MMTISVTLDVYSHIIAGLREVFASVREGALGGNPGVGGVGGAGSR
jgi:hypothetical protein